MMVKFAPQCLPPAIFSPCRTYRYLAARRAGWGDKAVAFIMLNPSTADEERNDPTVARCVGFAARWGYGWLLVVNLFPYRATDPHELNRLDVDVLGEYFAPALRTNDDMIRYVVHGADLVVAAWGNWGAVKNRSDEVRELLHRWDIPVKCFGLTKAGEPQHPLYVPWGRDLEDLP